LDMTEKYSNITTIDVGPDSSNYVFAIPQLENLTTTYFLKLKLENSSGNLISSNFYWLSTKPDLLNFNETTWYQTPQSAFADFTDLEKLPPVELILSYEIENKGEDLVAHVTIENPTDNLAFFIHLAVTRGPQGKEVLPILWDDNYFSLLPGENEEVHATFAAKNLNGAIPVVNATLANGHVRETTPLLSWLSLNTFKNDVSIPSNMTLLNENETVIQTGNNVSSCGWLLPYGKYYVQASIVFDGFIYTSEQIQVNLMMNTEIAINFLFGNLTISCLDIENRPLKNCTVIFARENEEQIGYTNSSGFTTVEAYYGNWTVKAYWIGVMVGESTISVNQSRIDVKVQCIVGDFTVIVVDQYGHFIEANVTLSNEAYDLILSSRIRKPMENVTFNQIPLIDYNLTVKDDFGKLTYAVNAERTRQIRIETISPTQELTYIMLGIITGLTVGSLGVWMLTKRKRKLQNR